MSELSRSTTTPLSDRSGAYGERQDVFPRAQWFPAAATVGFGLAGLFVGPALFPEVAGGAASVGGLLLGLFGGLCAFAHRFLE